MSAVAASAFTCAGVGCLIWPDSTLLDAGDDGDKDGDDRRFTEQTPKKKENRMADAGREALDIPIPIVSGGQAILRIPRTMSETDYTSFTKVLEDLLKGLKSALVVPTGPTEP